MNALVRFGNEKFESKFEIRFSALQYPNHRIQGRLESPFKREIELNGRK